MMNIEYKLVVSGNVEELEQQCSDYLNSGYMAYGAPFNTTILGKVHFCQAFILQPQQQAKEFTINPKEK